MIEANGFTKAAIERNIVEDIKIDKFIGEDLIDYHGLYYYYFEISYIGTKLLLTHEYSEENPEPNITDICNTINSKLNQFKNVILSDNLGECYDFLYDTLERRFYYSELSYFNNIEKSVVFWEDIEENFGEFFNSHVKYYKSDNPNLNTYKSLINSLDDFLIEHTLRLVEH